MNNKSILQFEEFMISEGYSPDQLQRNASTGRYMNALLQEKLRIWEASRESLAIERKIVLAEHCVVTVGAQMRFPNPECWMCLGEGVIRNPTEPCPLCMEPV